MLRRHSSQCRVAALTESLQGHAWAEEYWDHGYRMLAYGLDHMLFQATLSAGLRGLRTLASEARGADRPTQTPT